MIRAMRPVSGRICAPADSNVVVTARGLAHRHAETAARALPDRHCAVA